MGYHSRHRLRTTARLRWCARFSLGSFSWRSWKFFSIKMLVRIFSFSRDKNAMICEKKNFMLASYRRLSVIGGCCEVMIDIFFWSLFVTRTMHARIGLRSRRSRFYWVALIYYYEIILIGLILMARSLPNRPVLTDRSEFCFRVQCACAGHVSHINNNNSLYRNIIYGL